MRMRRVVVVAVMGALVGLAAVGGAWAAAELEPGGGPGADQATVDPTTSTPPGSAGPIGPGPTTAPVPPPSTAAPGPSVPAPRTPSTTVPTPSTPTVPVEPVPTTPAEPAVLRPGDRGEAVRQLQERLLAAGYWIGGEVDGIYGQTTAQAVMAFQKLNDLERDGLAGPSTRDALASAQRPGARSQAGTGRVVEIDLARQVLLVVDDGRVVEAFNTSTGSRATPTPPGRFEVERHIDGVRHAPLGDLYRPKYFNGGIAVHGSPSIPGHPASHGCARVHDRAMDHLWSTGALELGTTVWVY